MSSSMQDANADIKEMFDESKQNRDEIRKMSMTVEDMKGAINKLKSEIDRLEEFSRRNNLRMYGVPTTTCLKITTPVQEQRWMS